MACDYVPILSEFSCNPNHKKTQQTYPFNLRMSVQAAEIAMVFDYKLTIAVCAHMCCALGLVEREKTSS